MSKPRCVICVVADGEGMFSLCEKCRSQLDGAQSTSRTAARLAREPLVKMLKDIIKTFESKRINDGDRMMLAAAKQMLADVDIVDHEPFFIGS